MITEPTDDGVSALWRRFLPSSFRATIVLSTVAIMTLAVLVMGFGIQLLLGHTTNSDIDRVLRERASAMVTVVQAASQEHLTVPPDALDPGEEVFDSEGLRVAGSVEHPVRRAAQDLATTDRPRMAGDSDDEEQLFGTPFTTPSGERGVLVVSQTTEAYERSELYAMIATAVLGLLVIAGTGLMALRVTRQALKPVEQMAVRAADWSERELHRRFDLGPPSNELSALGQTIDKLLDRVASTIRSEQRLTAELAHELRTPLTAIQGAADLALYRGVADPATREDLEEISNSAKDMSGVITTLLDAARGGPPDLRGRTTTVADLMPALVAAVGPDLELDDRTAPSSARVAAPSDLVVRAVLPLVDNAVRHARSRVGFEAVDKPGWVELTVFDDGSGVAAGVRSTLFEAGVTGRPDGAGLGLVIARRVAQSFGGDVTLEDVDSGAAFTITLPRQ